MSVVSTMLFLKALSKLKVGEYEPPVVARSIQQCIYTHLVLSVYIRTMANTLCGSMVVIAMANAHTPRMMQLIGFL